MGATSPPGPDECCLHKTAYAREELSDYDALEVNRQRMMIISRTLAVSHMTTTVDTKCGQTFKVFRWCECCVGSSL